MPVSVIPCRRNIPHVRVQVEGLRIGKLCIRHSRRLGSPVRSDESTQAVGVISRSEIIEAGFRVTFFAGELVIFNWLPCGNRKFLCSNPARGDVSHNCRCRRQRKKSNPRNTASETPETHPLTLPEPPHSRPPPRRGSAVHPPRIQGRDRQGKTARAAPRSARPPEMGSAGKKK